MKKFFFFLLLSAGINLSQADTGEIRLLGRDMRDENGSDKVALQIGHADIAVNIHGMLARTRIELSIFNPTATEAQADVLIPLPPNSIVTGYALDIMGEMVDGVYVEKQLARYTYESIVSRMIDPGLLEAKGGDTFSVSVYPVPENNKRIFRLEFITDMAEQPYALPLQYQERIKDVSLSIGIGNAKKPPSIKYPKSMRARLVRNQNGYSAAGRWQNIDMDGVLRIRNGVKKRDRVLVEQSSTGDYYFLIDDYTGSPPTTERIALEHITVYWDASMSRGRADTAKELQLLEKLVDDIGTGGGTGGLTVDVVVFRNRGEEKTTFTLNGDAGPLIDHLQAVRYDGASNLEAALRTPLHENNDYCLLFTDGQINHGSRNVTPPCPLYIIDSGSAGRPYLEYLAAQSNGDYFALNEATPETIAAGIGAQPFRLLSVSQNHKGAEEIYMDGFKPGNGYLRFAGRLVSPQVSITLGYGTGRNIVHSETFELKQAWAPTSENARLLWAKNKIDSLLHTAVPDRQAIIETSRQHGVLSPYTSLLVLESPEQYAEYGIEPPASKQEWLQEYHEIVEARTLNKQEHFDDILESWSKLVEWWQTDFSRKAKVSEKQGSAAEIPSETASDQQLSRPESLQRIPGVSAPGAADESALQEVIVSGIRASAPIGPTGPRIIVKPWSPDRVYLTELDKAGEQAYFDKYLELREEHGDLPAYYIEVADFLRNKKQHELALQVLSNLAELDTSDYTTRRIMGYKLIEYGELDPAIDILESVLRDQAAEPQSHRDLALVLARRADRQLQNSRDRKSVQTARQDYLRALDLLYHVVLKPWSWEDREEIALVALVEINRLIAKCRSLGIDDFDIDKRLIKRLDVDLRVVASWHADNVDIDLWLIEPTGETAKYDNPLTAIGGHVSRDIITGFGPEEYLLRKAVKGKYLVKVHYYGSSSIVPTGAVKVLVDVYTNYARENEKKKVLTLELENKEDEYVVGEIEF
ncbi:MAG TPA: VIT domain-containing protein [Gammaproteobacteria bacterium]